MIFFKRYYIAMKPSLMLLFFIILNQAYADFVDLTIRHVPYYQFKKVYCPAGNGQDIANLEQASKLNYQVKYCLFETTFKTNEDKVCKTEINFLFEPVIGPTTKDCKTMHKMTFFVCGDQNELKKFQDEDFRKKPYVGKTTSLKTYLICYDMVEKNVLWTWHNILWPAAFRESLDPHSVKLPRTSTDPYFFMNPNLFLDLDTLYESERQKISDPNAIIMVPQPLVPPDHLADPLVKKSTNHYINMVPLWVKLIPLMKAIDQGIKRAAMQIDSQKPIKFNDIDIFTKVTLTEEFYTSERFNAFLFQGNIWYKLVYQRETHAAVMIIIYNTPGKPLPKKCAVGKRRKCIFEKWSTDQIVTSDYSKYAYCCEVKEKEVENVFSIKRNIKSYLEIENLIPKNNIANSRL